jgi:hypothetical protein
LPIPDHSSNWQAVVLFLRFGARLLLIVCDGELRFLGGAVLPLPVLLVFCVLLLPFEFFLAEPRELGC